MRRKLALAFILLSLMSCIPVRDFGVYWDKATIDARLAGNWKRIAATADQDRQHGYPIGDVLTIVDKGGVYELNSFDTSGKSRGNPIHPVKTLTVGKYQFLALRGPKEGMIMRYTISGRNLTFCSQFGPAMWEFVRTHYPRAVNVMKNDAEGEYIVVRQFDDEVFAILASIPDEDIMNPSAAEGYWACDIKFERAR